MVGMVVLVFVVVAAVMVFAVVMVVWCLSPWLGWCEVVVAIVVGSGWQWLTRVVRQQVYFK